MIIINNIEMKRCITKVANILSNDKILSMCNLFP